METSGLAWIPLLEVIVPLLKVKYLPTELSIVFICAVKFLSLSRSLNELCFLAVRSNKPFMPKSISEKIMFATDGKRNSILSIVNDLISFPQRDPVLVTKYGGMQISIFSLMLLLIHLLTAPGFPLLEKRDM